MRRISMYSFFLNIFFLDKRLFFLIAVHAICQPSLAKELVVEDVHLGVGWESDFNYRGQRVSSSGSVLSADLSAYGFSGSVRFRDGPSKEDILSEASISYSYALGFADLDLGVISTEFPSVFQRDVSEDVFIELRGNPTWNGMLPFEIIPSLKQSFSINSEGGNFTELKFEKQVIAEKYSLLFNPYVELGAGEFYTESWDLNHVEFGADLSWEFSDGFYLSPYYSVTKPLDALKEATGNDSSESRYGVHLRYKF